MPPRILPRPEARRRGGRLDMPVALTAVLLAAVADDDEPPLDDGHLLGILELPGHRSQRLPALRTALPIGLVEFVDVIHQRQPGLRARAVPRLRGPRAAPGFAVGPAGRFSLDGPNSARVRWASSSCRKAREALFYGIEDSAWARKLTSGTVSK